MFYRVLLLVFVLVRFRVGTTEQRKGGGGRDLTIKRCGQMN